MVFDYFKKIGMKRILLMLIGNVIIGMGVSIFKLSCLGNDAYNAMLMSLSDLISIPYGHFSALFSAALFVIQLVWGRKYIGIGTLVCAFGLGPFAHFFNVHLTEKILKKEK